MSVAVNAWAAAATPVPPEIEDPRNLGLNKEASHATLMAYPTPKEALAGRRRSSSWARDLNGTWKFNWVARPEQRPEGFHEPGYDVSRWANLPVPSCWQVHGYGTPYYRNAGYTFAVDPPRVMTEPPRDWTAYSERNPVGSYRREFEVPAAWSGRRVFATFDGVDSAFFLWINGKKVGYSVNSKNPAEFDVTAFVKPGKGNILALEVYRYCSGSYLEDQDKYRLSGIVRNVTLWTAPQVHVRDFFVRTDLDSSYRDGTLELTAWIRNYGTADAKPRALTLTLHDPRGRAIGAVHAAIPALKGGEETKVDARLYVANPPKWTAETPALHTTVLALGPDGGKPEEYLSCRTGFRKVEIRGRVFMVNGVHVKLKGANRHEHWADTGHYISEERMVRDIEVLKRGNCNHVRTCHYSDDPRWYELCDEYGLYLVAEANVECHGLYGKLDRDPSFEDAIVDRNRTNTLNFRNHGSVVMWSLGNENGPGSSFVKAMGAVKELDPTRPVHYQSFADIEPDNPADVDSHMYTHPEEVGRIATDPNRTKPYYMCEYAHAMNNSMGSIGDYNDVFDRHDSLMGGAIWEWQDQGLWNRRNPARIYLAYGGGFGEKPNDEYFIHKGVVWHDRTPKPHYPEMKKAYQWIAVEPVDLKAGKVRIRNKYQFIDLKRFRGAWEVSEDGKVVQHGNLQVPPLGPRQEAVVTIPFRAVKPKAGGEYFLRLSFTLGANENWAKAGHEVAGEQFLLPASSPAPVLKPAGAVGLSEEGSLINVSGRGFELVFDRKTGTISRVTQGGRELLLADGGPRPHFWRAPHCNDDFWANEGWRRCGLRSLSWRPLSASVARLSPSAVRVQMNNYAEGRRGFGVNHAAAYTVYGDGTIVMDNAMSFQGPRIALARVGLRLFLDRRHDRVSYLGRGPMENYPDRKRGSDVILHSGRVADELTPYAKPMEAGNHEDVRWMALADPSGSGLLAVAGDGGAGDSVMQASALPHSDEILEPPEYSCDLPQSRSTVLVLAARTLGVGSAACGPRPMDRYITYADGTRFTVVFRLLGGHSKDARGLARFSLGQRPLPPVASRQESERVSVAESRPGEKTSVACGTAPLGPWTGPVECGEGGVLSYRVEAAGAQPLSGILAFPSSVGEWKVRADSFQEDKGDPENAIDGDPHTFWHTQWEPESPKHPHELVIDFGKVLAVKGIRYHGREWNSNGRVADYEVYMSTDGAKWGLPHAKGKFENKSSAQAALFDAPVEGRYLKFVALSEVEGKPYASVAELDVIR